MHDEENSCSKQTFEIWVWLARITKQLILISYMLFLRSLCCFSNLFLQKKNYELRSRLGSGILIGKIILINALSLINKNILKHKISLTFRYNYNLKPPLS